MGGIFYLVGIALAGYAGYGGLQWYLIFISSLIMAVGYFVIRAPQIYGIVSNDGIMALPKLLSIQIGMYSIITAPVYFIATAFN